MKKIHVFVLILLFVGLNACKQNLIEASQPKAAKTAKQAKARLLAAPKWEIDEMYEDNQLVYIKGQKPSVDLEMDLEWVSFKDEGIFEVKTRDEVLDTSLRYELDETSNILKIYDSKEKGYFENWKIESGSVYSNSFEMSLVDINNGNEFTSVKIKMKTL